MNSKTRSRVLIGIAAAVAAYVVFGPTDPQPVEAAKTGNPVAARDARAKVLPRQSAMRSLLLLAHRVTAASASNALFATHSWYVPPPPPPPAPAPVSPVQSGPPPAPTAPPLPYQYIGSYTPDGRAPVFFLTRGDRVYDVHVGDTLDNTYSIDGFNGSQLLLTYKPLNIQQQLAAGGTP
jgi:hypothetical protein